METYTKQKNIYQLCLFPAPDLRGGQGADPRAPTKKGPTTMFTCLAICTTCACHLVIFNSEESLFVDAINVSVV